MIKFSVSIGAFTLAAVWDEKSRRKFHEEAELIVRKFYQQAQRMESPNEEREFEFSPGMKCALFLVLANCTVTVLWKIPQLRAFMWRYFSNSYASRSLCSPMLLSAFSHSSLLHLGINMYVLWTFASVSIDKFLGVPQFCAMYASASVVSSLTSLMHKSAIRSPIRALGASGAILGLLAYTCCKIPEARLQIVFLPFFDFSAQSAIIGVILFDLAGLLFGFKLFDHAAHLGGALFGVAYAQYGEKLWKRYSTTIGRWLN
ncbi:unnamed protein product, partial [Mesorhabditis belari]|uniref:rhomboid protease n=1 Tax=Mesorhabditis belari TaxID=2138241 RepID=A0AAF3FAF9_9BILA